MCVYLGRKCSHSFADNAITVLILPLPVYRLETVEHRRHSLHDLKTIASADRKEHVVTAAATALHIQRGIAAFHRTRIAKQSAH